MTFDKVNLDTENKACKSEPVRRLSVAHWQIELLPRSPYQTTHCTNAPSIGFAFDQQSGVHSIGSDKRSDFRASPNGLAFLPRDCDVYSESATGGEYLKVYLPNDLSETLESLHRVRNLTDRLAIQAAHGLRRELLRSDSANKLICEAHLLCLKSRVLAINSNQMVIDEVDTNSSSRWVTQLTDLIETRLDTQLTVSELADQCCLSVGYFSRKFRKAFGVTPHAYIIDRRLARARDCCRDSAQDLNSIAHKCGFSSHSQMTALFRSRLGVAPSQLRCDQLSK